MLTTGELRPPVPTWTEIDGVQTVWGSVEGPFSATLVFRVGHADETLMSSGTTHLIEHLALYREGLAAASAPFNGRVDGISTMFYLSGEEEDVAGFLSRICDHLQSPPFERIDTEREILRLEATGRPYGSYASLMRWRYGPRTYGLSTYEEFGLHRVGAADLTEWIRLHFTRQNAVLMLSGPPSAGLRLGLSDGVRRPPPPPSSALPQAPAWYHEGDPGAALLATVEQSPTAVVLRQVIEHRLHARLRYRLGASYHPTASLNVRDSTHTHLFLGVDAVPEHADAVRREVSTILRELGEEDVAAADLASWLRAWRACMVEPSARSGWLHGQAVDVLLGRAYDDYDSWFSALDAVTPSDVVTSARQAHETSLLRLGGELREELTDRAAAPAWSTGTAPTGTSYEEIRSKPEDPTNRLIVGGRAAAFEVGPDRRVKVAYEDVAAALAWPDGHVTLIGNDAFALTIHEHSWVGGSEAVAQIRAAVPADLWVELPSQGADPGPALGEPRAAWISLAACLTVALVGLVGVLAGQENLGVAFVVGTLASFRPARRLRDLRRVRGLRPLLRKGWI